MTARRKDDGKTEKKRTTARGEKKKKPEFCAAWKVRGTARRKGAKPEVRKKEKREKRGRRKGREMRGKGRRKGGERRGTREEVEKSRGKRGKTRETDARNSRAEAWKRQKNKRDFKIGNGSERPLKNKREEQFKTPEWEIKGFAVFLNGQRSQRGGREGGREGKGGGERDK
jgi:hypothetical protein